MKELIEYLESNLIDFVQKSKNVVEIDNQTYQLVEPDEEGFLFDESLEMTCEDTVEDNYVFKFGGIWYWTPRGTETQPKFNRLKYIGKAKLEFPSIPWLGVRGKNEILNGSRDYKDWCRKAKFLGVDVLGICEKNSLAGALQFQEECKANKIKSIIGATYTIFNEKKDQKYDVKVYAKNYDGWQTILSINKAVLVDNYKFISEQQFKSLETSNIHVIVDPKSLLFENIDIKFDFYQYDSVQYSTPQTDISYLNNLKKYIQSSYKPILIQDSFYLDKDDAHIKQKLNSISGVRELTSNNQYFKSFDEIFDEFDKLFDSSDELFSKLLDRSKSNLQKLVDSCDFVIETGHRHLPKYKMNEEEKKVFKTNRELFDHLIEEGFKKRVPKGKEKEYRERLNIEIDVIEYGDVIDYFLILWDIIKWCKTQNILVGIGRGSAGGALTSYLLEIIQLDPIQYDLLFERFLNKSRVEKSMPDIDTDFEGVRRNEVKRYMEQKYGEFQVCSVGTYTTLKAKAILKDLGKMDGASIGEIEFVNKIIADNSTFDDLFYTAAERSVVKNFITKHIEAINDMPLIFKQPRAGSIHACATLILPDEKSVFEFCPVKKMKLADGQDVLVTEWEGNELEKAGFLKEDILGVLQLDKFRNILDLIGKDIDIYNLPLSDKKVYKYFQKGWNGDVFHFGSNGLTGYCKELQPENIHDLIAAISLYRPGAMENNFHNEYILRKEGKKEVDYFIGSEKILDQTYGVFVYQEQIMKLCQVLGGLSLIEADDVRKAMVKKKYDELTKYKERFLPYYINTFKVSEEYANNVWDAIDKASCYLFNKSHATAYALTGYICQWLKVHYPIHYWVTSFTFTPEGKKDEKIPAYISEVHQSGDIKLRSVDINKSGDGFTGDFENNSIYWSLNSVKQCGDKAVEQLVQDKQERGDYFDFKEFLNRNVHKGSKVTKQVIEHLVISGAFDEVENIKQSKDRWELIQYYREQYKIKVTNENDIFTTNQDALQYNWWWNMHQKRLCGFALFDFKVICDNFLDSSYQYQNILSESAGQMIKTGGYINDIVVRTTKKGEYADVILDNNFEFIPVKFWYDQWKQVKSLIEGKNKCLLLITGKVNFDKYKDKHVLVANSDSEILVLE